MYSFKKLWLLAIFIGFLGLSVHAAASDSVFEATTKQSFEDVYQSTYKALEKNKFYVIFEAHISKNLKSFETKWGEDFNRNKLGKIRAMTVCNIWYVNKVANADPRMLSLCPLSITFVENGSSVSILFRRPTMAAQNSPALPIIKEVEETIIRTIQSVVE